MPHFVYPVPASFFGFPEQRRAFSPKFDVHETDKAYVLEGDLPGLEKSNLSIEFTDPVTLLIKGRIEKSYTSTTPSESPAVEKPSTPKPESRSSSPTRSLNPTVEDEKEEGSSSTPVVSTEAPAKKTVEKKEFRPRQWVSERTVGAFQRTFTFPTGIDQDAVTAGLEHGVLRIEVPKRAPVTRRIEIQ